MSQANIHPTFALAIINAAKKGLDAETARAETTPGVYRGIKVAVQIEVDEMRVAPDTDKAPTTSIPLLTTCALLLQRLYPDDPTTGYAVLSQVMREALEMSADEQKKLLAEFDVAALERKIKDEVVATLPRVPVKGAVTVKPEHVRVLVTGMTMGDV